MTAPSTIQFTSKDFWSIMADINSDPLLTDKPDWFKRIMAGVGDMLSMNTDAVANNGLLRTAFTRRAVQDLLQLIDYQLSPQVTSSGTLLFYISRSASFPVTLATLDLVATSQGTSQNSSLRFEALAGKTVSAFSETFTTSGDLLSIARTNGYYTGDLVRLTTGGTLPAPLSLVTDYYVISVSTTTIKLATSVINAYAGINITLTDAGTGTHTIVLYSTPVTVYQQKSLTTPVIIGQSDAATKFQSFNLPDINVLKSTLTLTINSVTWTRVDTFVNSVSTDKVFKLYYNTDNTSFIEFGNGVYGAIPATFSIYAQYATGGGLTSNIANTNMVNLYAGTNANITGVSNTTAMTNGSDPQDLNSAKQIAPMLLKQRSQFITADDGKALVLAYGGISICQVNPNYYGVLSAQFLCVPIGGGNLAAGTKTALIAYLKAKSVLDSVNIQFVDASYTATAFTSQLKVLSGYTYALVLPYYELGVHLLFSERTQEIYNTYQANGIASAVTLINSIWAYSFVSSDYPQITILLDNATPSSFGLSIQLSDVEYLLKLVTGVDYFNITLPATFPVTFTTMQISTDGAITTTSL